MGEKYVCGGGAGPLLVILMFLRYKHKQRGNQSAVNKKDLDG